MFANLSTRRAAVPARRHAADHGGRRLRWQRLDRPEPGARTGRRRLRVGNGDRGEQRSRPAASCFSAAGPAEHRPGAATCWAAASCRAASSRRGRSRRAATNSGRHRRSRARLPVLQQRPARRGRNGDPHDHRVPARAVDRRRSAGPYRKHGRLDGRASRVRFGFHDTRKDLRRRSPHSRGRVATYGQIAELAGLPGHARQVGYAMAALPVGNHGAVARVINAAGMVSRRRSGAELAQRQLLEGGMRFDARGKVEMKKVRWKGRA